MFSSNKSMVPIVQTESKKAVMMPTEKKAEKVPEVKKAMPETRRLETK